MAVPSQRYGYHGRTWGQGGHRRGDGSGGGAGGGRRAASPPAGPGDRGRPRGYLGRGAGRARPERMGPVERATPGRGATARRRTGRIPAEPLGVSRPTAPVPTVRLDRREQASEVPQNRGAPAAEAA